jgi:nitrogen fixation protein NifU and related proteins
VPGQFLRKARMQVNPYGEVILEHFRHPRNYGSLESPDIRHEDVNPLCGDRIRIELTVSREERVIAARFQGDLCVIAKAASSILTEMITGWTLEDIGQLAETQMLDALHAEIRPARLKCALLPLGALHAGVNAYCASRNKLG